MNQIDIKNGVLLTILACKSSQQSVLSLVSLDLFLLLVFLLYVWGDVASSTCCCWVVRRYTGIPYIDSCPVPARHGCVLVVPARPGFPEARAGQHSRARAGQPALASSSAAWPRTGAPKSPKWSPHPPLDVGAASDLESEAEVRFLWGRPILGLFAGGGARTPGGREGGSAHGGLKGGRGFSLILPITRFSEEVKRCR